MSLGITSPLKNAIDSFESNGMKFSEHTTKLDTLSAELVDKHAPVVSWKSREGAPPWMDTEFIKSRALRRKYERLWRSNRTEENRMNYTRQKKLCVDMALEKQKIHYSKILEDAGSCQKTLFKIANELLDHNEERVLPTHTDAKKLANEFNQFYVDKVQKIRNSIPEVTTDLSYCAQPFQGQRLEFFRPTQSRNWTK